MNDQSTPRLGDFELLIALAIAALDENAYGASLAREIEEQTGRTISIGAVYKTLDRLDRKAMVTSSVGAPSPERGGRRRKIYRLSQAGRMAVEHSLADIDDLRARAGSIGTRRTDPAVGEGA